MAGLNQERGDCRTKGNGGNGRRVAWENRLSLPVIPKPAAVATAKIAGAAKNGAKQKPQMGPVAVKAELSRGSNERVLCEEDEPLLPFLRNTLQPFAEFQFLAGVKLRAESPGALECFAPHKEKRSRSP